MSDKQNYWSSVEDIARDILSDHGTDEDKWQDAVHEHVDSSSWIIYYGNNEEVLDNTDNEPDNGEIMSMSNKDGDWRDLRQTAAFLAMEGDVYDKLRELASEYEPSYFKLKKQDGSFVTNNEVTGAEYDETPLQNNEDVRYDSIEEAEEIAAMLDLNLFTVVAFTDDDNEVPLPE